jgi:hypothetical protein
MGELKQVDKIFYNGRTIFKYLVKASPGKIIFLTQAGVSRVQFRTLGAAKRAVDRVKR